MHASKKRERDKLHSKANELWLELNLGTIATWSSQVALVVKNLPTSAEGIRVAGLIPELGQSPGEGHGNPLQYPCLENPTGQSSLAGYSP